MTGNSAIKDLYIQNYPVHCFSISGCSNLLITNIHLNNTAGYAPNAISNGLAAAHNTDGFDISSSTNMILSDSIVYNQVRGCTRCFGIHLRFLSSPKSMIFLDHQLISLQDDCVAITSGSNILVKNMYCSGGHGLSIGSVGGKSNNNVTGVL